MDDWNDFGPPDAPRPPRPPLAASTAYPRSDSAPSSLEDSVSDGSVALLRSRSSTSTTTSTASSGSSYIPPPTESSSDPSRADPARDTDHSSFLSSIPFLGGAASRSRRAERQAAAAVAAANALADGRLAASTTPVTAIASASASASTAPAGGARSPAVAPVVVPLDRSAHADRGAQQDHSDQVSATSDSDSMEPASRMLPPSRREADPDDEILPAPIPTRRGALDDVPADFELNIHGFRYNNISGPNSMNSELEDPHSSVIASSLLRVVEKSYTKLEVITAKDIRNMLLIFNMFVFVGLIWTIVTIVLGHTSFAESQDLPIPENLLYPEQRANAITSILVPLSTPPQGKAASLVYATPPPTPPLSKSRGGFPPGYAEPLRIIMAAQGLCISRNGGGIRTCDPIPIPRDSGIIIIPNGDPNRPCPNCLQVDNTTRRLSEQTDDPLTPFPDDQISVLRQEEVEYVKAYTIHMTVAVASRSFKMLSHVISITFSFFFFILGCLFAVRLFRQGRRSTSHEQMWVLVLIFVTSFYFNAFESSIRLIEELDENVNEDKFSKWVFDLETALTVGRDVAFTVFSFFYLWASLHSYRILDPTKPLSFKTFYLPKLAVLVPYTVFKSLCLVLMKMQLSEVPMMSAPALWFTFGEFNMWYYLRAEILSCVAASFVEFLLVVLIVYEAIKSLRILRRAPYMKHRTKRVGFRFFMYINFLFYPSFIFLQVLIMFARDKGENVVQIIPGIDMPKADALWFHTVGPMILVAGYVLVTAHVHLPYTSVGAIKGWFKSSPLAESGSRWSFTSTASGSTQPAPSVDSVGTGLDGSATWVHDENTPRSVVDNDDEMDHQIIEPFTYRMKESPDSLELKANCFTMQTHVILFNFAWYVYYYGTPKLNNWNAKNNPLPFEYSIAAHIKSDLTDTQALVLDCFDRIVVAFKGTTSKRNLRTSLQMNYENVRSVIRTNIRGEDVSNRLRRIFGRKYANGKIHKGFAVAYRSVASEVMSNVKQLRREKNRPVFFTGHSLGGALATICSMDAWVKLELSRREIFVSTFGSPRVGNVDFADMYDEVVPLHWRIVVDPDMVAKLPKGGYRHVGKKAVLTPHGDMIIDPNLLEKRPWSGETAGFAYHRKASYLLAMRAWCVRNHAMMYTPDFWPFPLRKEDHKRFASAFNDDEEMTKGHSNRIASKIMHMDAMVDALGHGDKGLSNMALVEKWGRLTRRILLNEQLRERTSEFPKYD